MEFTLKLETLGRVKFEERPLFVTPTSLRGIVGCLTTPGGGLDANTPLLLGCRLICLGGACLWRVCCTLEAIDLGERPLGLNALFGLVTSENAACLAS